MIKAAVLGSPISHSLSPILHSSAYKYLGVDGSYEAIEVLAGDLGSFMAALDSGWNNFSLTMPLKEELVALGYPISDLALRIQSANTLHKTATGWSATTTDVGGFVNALSMHGVEVNGNIVIIGAGATARAAASACDSVETHITVVTRSAARIPAMSQAVQFSELQCVSWENLDLLNDADLVISTTPEGATDEISSFFPLITKAPYFEALYKPWPTVASKKWAEGGGQVIDGLDLLIHQAMLQIEIFTGLTFDSDEIYGVLRDVGLEALK